MNLNDFLKLWFCFGSDELIVIDRRDAKSYYNFKMPIELYHRYVSGFYLDNNKLVVRVE